MPTHSRIGTVIEELEAERAHLAARIEKVDEAIATMRELFHLPNGKPQRPAERRRPATDRRAQANSNGGADAPALEAAICAALADRELSPGDLARAVKTDRALVRQACAVLQKRGLLTITGATTNRVVSLAGKSRPKEAP